LHLSKFIKITSIYISLINFLIIKAFFYIIKPTLMIAYMNLFIEVLHLLKH